MQGDFELKPQIADMHAIHRSCNGNQSAILLSIMELHNDGERFQLDPCYNKGVMYGDLVPKPIDRLDRNPEHCIDGVKQGDFTDLPYADKSVGSVVWDPPFIVGKDNHDMSIRYGFYKTLEELQQTFDDAFREFDRVIKRHGLLVVKCQDIINNRRKYMVSYFVLNTAMKYGFWPIDEYIKTNKSRPNQGSTVAHASRSYHSKFIVFRHRRGKRKFII